MEYGDLEDYVDGLTAADLSPFVDQALERNQEIPLSSRCSHVLAVLRLERKPATPIWRRLNYVSNADTQKVTSKVQEWLEADVIEVAPQTCTNNFPLLAVPKKDAQGRKVDIRPCLDLRQLNPRLDDMNYPMPRIQAILDRLG